MKQTDVDYLWTLLIVISADALAIAAALPKGWAF